MTTQLLITWDISEGGKSTVLSWISYSQGLTHSKDSLFLAEFQVVNTETASSIYQQHISNRSSPLSLKKTPESMCSVSKFLT